MGTSKSRGQRDRQRAKAKKTASEATHMGKRRTTPAADKLPIPQTLFQQAVVLGPEGGRFMLRAINAWFPHYETTDGKRKLMTVDVILSGGSVLLEGPDAFVFMDKVVHDEQHEKYMNEKIEPIVKPEATDAKQPTDGDLPAEAKQPHEDAGIPT